VLQQHLEACTLDNRRANRYQLVAKLLDLFVFGVVEFAAALARFLESIERSGYPVAVTRLNIRRRSGELDSYDVEVGVSSYDRLQAAPVAPAAGSAKP
jgi:hypothetical protein